MTAFTLTGLLALLAGCAALYLASPNQRWLARPWPGRPARLCGALLLVLGWLGLWQTLQAVTASFVFATALMLAFSVYPYIGALLGRKGAR